MLVRAAVENDFVIVTRNVRDFRELLEAVEAHCGLVSLQALDDAFDVDTQLDLFEAALLALDGETQLTNVELEVLELADGDFDVKFRALPR
ncbi:MAG: hypothetical protein DI536_09795 [Archangium gephyra]|uniref:DUF5615 domain-containing protein n=1 Tax=Archangium gephyra TaxID=48 RepID=A0A2W5TR88_9BACT|nr:MAG: hypothetical protein DI536_09795 [Archangium gephyra]